MADLAVSRSSTGRGRPNDRKESISADDDPCEFNYRFNSIVNSVDCVLLLVKMAAAVHRRSAQVSTGAAPSTNNIVIHVCYWMMIHSSEHAVPRLALPPTWT